MYYRLRIPPFCWPLYLLPQLFTLSPFPSFSSSLSPPPSLSDTFFSSYLPPLWLLEQLGPRNSWFKSIYLPSPKAPLKVLSTGSRNGMLQSSCVKSWKEGRDDKCGILFHWSRVWPTSPLLLTGDTTGWALRTQDSSWLHPCTFGDVCLQHMACPLIFSVF